MSVCARGRGARPLPTEVLAGLRGLFEHGDASAAESEPWLEALLRFHLGRIPRTTRYLEELEHPLSPELPPHD